MADPKPLTKKFKFESSPPEDTIRLHLNSKLPTKTGAWMRRDIIVPRKYVAITVALDTENSRIHFTLPHMPPVDVRLSLMALDQKIYNDRPDQGPNQGIIDLLPYTRDQKPAPAPPYSRAPVSVSVPAIAAEHTITVTNRQKEDVATKIPLKDISRLEESWLDAQGTILVLSDDRHIFTRERPQDLRQRIQEVMPKCILTPRKWPRITPRRP